MADPFDPSQFDTPPPAADPNADYRILLDAMKQAGADGVAEAESRILAAIQQDADTRAIWNTAATASLSALQKTAEDAKTAAEAARKAGDWTSRRALILAIGAAVLVGGVSWGSLAWQRNQVADMHAQRAALAAEIATSQETAAKLQLRGADLEWSTCTVPGTFRDKQRRCIKVARDTSGPKEPTFFGKSGGPYYFIPEGY